MAVKSAVEQAQAHALNVHRGNRHIVPFRARYIWNGAEQDLSIAG